MTGAGDEAVDSSCFDSASLVYLPAPFFTDLWFTHQWRDIEWLHGAGFTNGCTPTLYCPFRSLDRGEMAAFLVRALGLPATEEDFFTDDGASTYEDSINRLAAAEVATGCGPGLYCPKGTLTREEMASFLVRGFGLPASEIDRFTDDEASTHEADINALAAADVTRGCSDADPSLFCPTQAVRRDKMAAFLFRLLATP